MKEFISWGVMGDWKTPYKTMDTTFVKNQIELFQWLLSKGYIYQRYMPVYWSPSSKTALAESELEYNAKHQSTAIYTRFKVTKNNPLAKELFKTADIYLLVWTTTPWSLVANRAVCFNPKLEYCFVKHPLSEDCYIVAVESLQNKEFVKEQLDCMLDKGPCSDLGTIVNRKARTIKLCISFWSSLDPIL